MATFTSYIHQRSLMEILATQLADLFSAVQCSDEKQIRRLLSINVSPNQQNKQGITALMVATKIGNSKIIKMLRGATLEKRPSAPLFCSQIVSNFSTAASPTAALSSFMAADFSADFSADFPIHQPTSPPLFDRLNRSHDVMSVSVVLPVGPTDVSSFEDALPLSVADDRHRVDSAPLIGDSSPGEFPPSDSSPGDSPPSQSSPSQSSPSQSSPSQSSPSQSSTDSSSSIQSLNDQTARLKTAICDNDLGAVEALLSAGVRVQSTHWYDTPLLVLAAENANSGIVKALLQAGASVNRGYNRLPLNVASERGNFEVVHMLMCAGAYLEATEESGYTALMSAAAAGHLLIVQTLVACGANVNVNYYGKTPLMLAAINGHTKVYDFLYPYLQQQGSTDTMLQQQAMLAVQHSRLDREMFSLFDAGFKTTSPP